MAVIELALFKLKCPAPTTTSTTVPMVPIELLNNLTTAAKAQASFSNHPVFLIHCVEDPSLIYLVGGWSSAAHHMDDWIPGSENQELLQLLSGDLEVKWMFHLSGEPVLFAQLLKEVKSSDGVVAIGRHFMKHAARDDFSRTFPDNVNVLEEFLGNGDRDVAGKKLVMGWRIDDEFVAPEEGKYVEEGDRKEIGKDIDEFVLFTAWPNVEKHMDFAKTEGFKRYSQIKELVDGAEIKHGKVFSVVEP
ncbi:hypothetical protein H2198_009556 [Neophaeococcomyces mojaviensis]|uniref:Uncharacterized protein n=1 Tax=Neophaeococcomyces mojaviensis TaxID=3383035 RepID=A0ACC2ZU96_9EURO|nr:hypothetical protein H2198_009556 [Knufia sp. JES_112]